MEWRGRCSLCPRACGADRSAGRAGFCREGAAPRVAWAGLHFGEEPPLTGSGGSGAIFFSGCTLRCRYCQNDQLSRQGLGRELCSEELAHLMLALQREAAENVNLVTGSHFTPVIVEAMDRARQEGLAIPLLWNSSGYESPATLELLAPWIDTYLPDCKTLDPELSRRFMGAPDYPEVVQAALPAMVEARPLLFEAERLRQGVIVRHLVLPGYLESSRAVLAWFRERLYGRALLSVMVQYTPNRRWTGSGAGTEGKESERLVSEAEGWVPVQRAPEEQGRMPIRRVSQEEYRQVLGWLDELGIEEGFIQEPEADSNWLPDFTRRNPFPEAQARPVWHYADDRLP
jgi:putative pyruvate formate lyase activating enzyme